MDKKILRLLQLVILLLIVYTIWAGLPILSYGRHSDYGSVLEIDTKNNCIERDPDYWEINPTLPMSPRIEVSMHSYAYYKPFGGSDRPFYKQSETDLLKIQYQGINLNFGRIGTGDLLKINNFVLKRGESVYNTNVLYFNPWAVSFYEVTNRGLMADCNAQFSRERIFAEGRFGTRPFVIKGITVLCTLLFILVALIIQNRKIAV
jgi:hypothetical protein